ncbi:PREDICTED: leukocyte surface antigen CD47 isoform X7 [Calidris pugnax]|uniref:leukocyte surface antigen CD47 isoform X7 n=1 Tax=Calidris pugnax TaxID=198806 RepID=UPI00071DF358|nr:PREDICTED: leukocyte surface antigen CD47 isoform X7 [Calidris pugnax]
MWQRAAWMLLCAVGAGSAQLLFNATDVVKKTDCNKTVILPCCVTNLNQNNIGIMFVKWKRQGQLIFSFDGRTRKYFRHPSMPSAVLLSEKDLTKGVASLELKNAEAEVGNYSCEVTESNREGETRFELKKYAGSWFLLLERALIISLLFIIIILWLVQLSLIAFKYEIETRKKMGIIIAGVFATGAAIVGTVLFVQDGYTVHHQAGLGLIVVPAMVFIPLQYFMFGIVFDNLPQATFVLVGLQTLGYVIAVAGFVLCVPVCPPIHASVIIAGLAILAIAYLLSLSYVFIMGSRMKDHPRPGVSLKLINLG